MVTIGRTGMGAALVAAGLLSAAALTVPTDAEARPGWRGGGPGWRAAGPGWRGPGWRGPRYAYRGGYYRRGPGWGYAGAGLAAGALAAGAIAASAATPAYGYYGGYGGCTVQPQQVVDQWGNYYWRNVRVCY